MESALKKRCGCLLLDIEDSVQPIENNRIARDKIKRYIKEGKFKNKIIFPRVNDREWSPVTRCISTYDDGVEDLCTQS